MPTKTITYEKVQSGLLKNCQAFLAKKIPLQSRKLLIPIMDKLKTFEKECIKERDRLLFLYSKPAPANWPNADQMVIEAVLFVDEEGKPGSGKAQWDEYVRESEALLDRSFDVEWERIPAKLTKKEADGFSLAELELCELFCDVQEEATASKAD